MAVSLETKLLAVRYDALRRTKGITGDLTLYRESDGYQLLATITGGWYARREVDRVNAAEVLAVRIAATDENVEKLATGIRYLVAVGVKERKYGVRDKLEPFEEPAQWLIRCDPTGEAA